MDSIQVPDNVDVTIDDFRNCGWREIVDNIEQKNYPNYSSSFSQSASLAIKANEIIKSKVLWLLADACSMMLDTSSINQPFKPSFVIEGRRSAIPEDFSAIDLLFFENILSEIDDFRLRARLADILWLVKRPRKPALALDAIDTYRQFPLEGEVALHSMEAWKRAIKLTRMLNDGAGDRLQKISNDIFSEFEKININNELHAFRLSELLMMTALDDDKSKEIAAKLEAFAENAKKLKDWHCSRMYYDASIEWYSRLKDNSSVIRLTVDVAETYVLNAEEGNPSNMIAGHFLELAIHTYRKIPKTERAQYKINERIEELQKKMTAANQLAVDNMHVLETSVDLSECIEANRNNVRGKEFLLALRIFANINRRIKVDEIRQRAETGMQHFSKLFASTHMTHDGRVAARTPGVNIADINSPETQKALWKEMLKEYSINTGLIAQAAILPVLEIINAEHRITWETLVILCRDSYIVPVGREKLWAKGLYHGFENDFIVSTHLLIPQLEHLVRVALKSNGAKTTTLDAKGIETENGLSTLLDNPDIGKTLDDNLIFEFKALLADSIGPNLRNEVAHGLSEEHMLMSTYTVYLWWLCFNLVINSIQWENATNIQENETRE